MKIADQLGTLAEKQNRLAGILNNKEVHTAAKYEAVRWQMKYELKKKNIALQEPWHYPFPIPQI